MMQSRRMFDAYVVCKKYKVGLHEAKKYDGRSACSNKRKMEMRVLV